jgi:hypothetical protein
MDCSKDWIKHIKPIKVGNKEPYRTRPSRGKFGTQFEGEEIGVRQKYFCEECGKEWISVNLFRAS